MVRNPDERTRGKALKSAVACVHGDAEIAAAPDGSLGHSCVAGTQMRGAKDGTLVYRSRSFAWAGK